MEVPSNELQWRFEPSGGPGGQHANRSSTRAVLTFDVSSSRAFDEETRRRIVENLGSSVIVVEADGSRSQWQNRRTALARLRRRLEAAAAPPPPERRLTEPSPASRRRRVEDKRRRGARKRLRRPPTEEQ